MYLPVYRYDTLNNQSLKTQILNLKVGITESLSLPEILSVSYLVHSRYILGTF